MSKVGITSRPDSERREKNKKICEKNIFTLLFGAAKGFMKVFKAFIEYSEVSQRSEKIKI